MVLSWILLYGTKARVIENLLPRFLHHKCTIICYDPWIVSLPLHMRVRDHTCKGSVEVCPTFIKYNIQTYYISLGGLSTHCQLALSWIFLQKCKEQHGKTLSCIIEEHYFSDEMDE